MRAWPNQIWDRFFFEERPSPSLGLFRIALALCVGLHVLPTFIPLADNYLESAYKEKHPVFFPSWILGLVDWSPDGLIVAAAAIFAIVLLCFLIGYRTRPSAILTFFGCIYFYALNSRDLRTLAWDALLISLFLTSLTSYPGDHFSLDAMLKKNQMGPGPFWDKRGLAPFGVAPPLRPFFIQRLLQLQIAWIYFYSGLAKVWPGNWVSGNAYYYLMSAPREWAVRPFPFRDVLAARPELCYLFGLGVVGLELALPFLLFLPRTRRMAIALGVFFHVFLFATMHLPAIFPLLFISQLLLFIPLRGKRTVDFSRHGNTMTPNFTPSAEPMEGVFK